MTLPHYRMGALSFQALIFPIPITTYRSSLMINTNLTHKLFGQLFLQLPAHEHDYQPHLFSAANKRDIGGDYPSVLLPR